MLRIFGLIFLLAAGAAPASAFTPTLASFDRVATISVPAALSNKGPVFEAQNNPNVAIAPSQAMHAAMRVAPGSQALRVQLLKRRVPMYAVKLKSGSRILTILVDARTGRVLRR